MPETYRFGNGVEVLRAHLEAHQIARYALPGNPNLHEPVEEDWLLRTFAIDLPERPVFLDVGAAIGYYSLLLKSKWPETQILAVEPLPRHVEAIVENFRLNSLELTETNILRFAIAANEGRAWLDDYGYGAYVTSEPASRGLYVSTKKLSSLLRTLPAVHLMKMDIQGLELQVFEQDTSFLASRKIRHIVVGTHGRDVHEALLRTLGRAGYKVPFEDPQPDMQPDGLIVASLQ